MGLFRSQLVARARPGLEGDVLVLPRRRHGALALLLLVWLAVVVIFLTHTSYARRESVRGWLHPRDGVVRVYPQREGQLARLLVDRGDRVAEGQPLAVLQGSRTLADGHDLDHLLLTEYETQRQLLLDKRTNELAQRRQREKTLSQRIAATRQELELTRARVRTLARRRQLDGKQWQRVSLLKPAGHITATELDALQARALESREAHLAAAAALEQQRQVLQSVQAEMQRLPLEIAAADSEIALRLSTLAQQIARLQGSRAHVLRAPLAGTISDIKLHTGERALPGRPLLSLLPDGSEIIATLLVPVRAAGFLREGQHLQLRYDAFPYQKFGSYAGRVLSVSASTTLPGENGTMPVQIAEPFYRVTARIDKQNIEAHGQLIGLKTGMTLSADIRLEDRSLLQWLFEPLFTLRGHLK